MSVGNCKVCVFYNPEFDELTQKCDSGSCRKDPPVVAQFGEDGDLYYEFVFPQVFDDTWCGKFELRKV